MFWVIEHNLKGLKLCNYGGLMLYITIWKLWNMWFLVESILYLRNIRLECFIWATRGCTLRKPVPVGDSMKKNIRFHIQEEAW